MRKEKPMKTTGEFDLSQIPIAHQFHFRRISAFEEDEQPERRTRLSLTGILFRRRMIDVLTPFHRISPARTTST